MMRDDAEDTFQPHKGPLGSSLESLFEEEDLAEIDAKAQKRILSTLFLQRMKAMGMTLVALAERMGTSRTQVRRVLDPSNDRVSYAQLAKAGVALGVRIRLDIEEIEEMPTGPSTLNDTLESLFDEAITRYGPRCLWNVKPQKTPSGLRVIADKLRKHGDMEAWKIAARIREELDHAAG